ncbi:M56 family metallopeptidase [Nocardia sp. NPDC020380]|uniref:M56 family metallopeptidase n=1 Tax=Nocardia sp. NPDC020380 TaxID=3364309 RepID=UPI0037903FD6
MHIAVYLPLLLPAPASLTARWLSARLSPRAGTWLLTIAAAMLAAANGIALSVLTATAVGQLPFFAALGRWSASVLRRDDPASLVVALVAGAVLSVASTAAARMLLRRTAAVLEAARAARGLPGGARVAVVDDPAPDAYAVPGRPGRIVVSTGMLDALDAREQQALLAHEHAHLTGRHHLFVALVDLACATNPFLRSLADAVRYTTERWADEHAAATVGDRRLVARTIGKAALISRRDPTPPSIALGMTGGPAPSLRGAGPIPRRVAAMLTTPARADLLAIVLAIAVPVLALAASVEAMRDLHALFELAELGTR